MDEVGGTNSRNTDFEYIRLAGLSIGHLQIGPSWHFDHGTVSLAMPGQNRSIDTKEHRHGQTVYIPLRAKNGLVGAQRSIRRVVSELICERLGGVWPEGSLNRMSGRETGLEKQPEHRYQQYPEAHCRTVALYKHHH